MGYDARTLNSTVVIEKANFKKLSEELMEFLEDFPLWEAFYKEKYGDFPAKAIESAFKLVGFDTEWSFYDEECNIAKLFFPYGRYDCDEIEPLMDIIAPFVKEGGEITFEGEEGDLWGFRFRKGIVFPITGEVAFKESDPKKIFAERVSDASGVPITEVLKLDKETLDRLYWTQPEDPDKFALYVREEIKKSGGK